MLFACTRFQGWPLDVGWPIRGLSPWGRLFLHSGLWDTPTTHYHVCWCDAFQVWCSFLLTSPHNKKTLPTTRGKKKKKQETRKGERDWPIHIIKPHIYFLSIFLPFCSRISLFFWVFPKDLQTRIIGNVCLWADFQISFWIIIPGIAKHLEIDSLSLRDQTNKYETKWHLSGSN